jgi:hypothetical protein
MKRTICVLALIGILTGVSFAETISPSESLAPGESVVGLRNGLGAHQYLDLNVEVVPSDMLGHGTNLMSDISLRRGMFNIINATDRSDRISIYGQIGKRMTNLLDDYAWIYGVGADVQSPLNSFDFGIYLGLRSVSVGNPYGDTPDTSVEGRFHFTYHIWEE